MDEEKSNIAKGRTSFDANVDGSIIPFFNRKGLLRVLFVTSY